MLETSVIWWLTLAISMIPFTYGLIYLWRRVDQGQATVTLPPGIKLAGPPGFAIFALGLAGGALSVWHLLPAVPPTKPPMGEVRQIDRIPPFGSGEARGPQIADWLLRFQRDARIEVTMKGGRDVRPGDYLAALSESAPERLPANLGNLDSDTTALLRVSGGNQVDVHAILASFASEEAAGQQLGSGQRAQTRAATVIEQLQPVRPGQRVLLIDHAERNARDRLRDAAVDADAAPVSMREELLRRVIDLADDFVWEHSGGFFAAEALLTKGEAQVKLGDVAAAIATYRRFKRYFPANPASARMDERIRRFDEDGPQVKVGRVTATLAASSSESVVPASDIAVTASSVLPAQGRVDYDAANVLDGDPGTVWSEGARGYGAGVTLKFTFARAYDLRALSLINGNAKSSALFAANGRTRTLRITTDHGPANVRVADTRRLQRLRLRAGRTRSVEITILSAYAGTLEHTMLSEMKFLTR